MVTITTIQYISAVIIGFLGLFAGCWVSKLAKDELKSGKIYFAVSQKVILSLFAIFFFYFAVFTRLSLLSGSAIMLNIALFFFLGVTIFLLLRFRISPSIVYPVLGFCLYLMPVRSVLFVLTTFVFLYGIMVFAFNPKLKQAVSYLWYFVTALFPVIINLFF